MPLAAERIEPMYRAVTEAWRRAGRDGRPRFLGGAYVALGGAIDEARANIRRSYAALGPEIADWTASAILTDGDAIRSRVAELEAIGVDEVFLMPPTTSCDQVEQLAEVVL
jgi:alkanesulfonate monooxygenase SsuD/methylene tetrahydromethanopterin reductase-like flavin-dependent oxidoreductase (luciferase family)